MAKSRSKKSAQKQLKKPKQVAIVPVILPTVPQPPQKAQFPSISRSITESALVLKQRNRYLWLSLYGACIAFLIFLTGVTAGDYYASKKALQVQEEKRKILSQKRDYWEAIVGKYGGYRDGYMQLAVFSYQLGDIQKAKEYLAKTLTIDPNFAQGRAFERILNK